MTNALTTAAAGFGTGLSLIVAIGAQNALVLRQGVRREAVLPVVAICALSDAVLIALGVAGVGAVVVAWPSALTAVSLLGAAFLIGYGVLAARRVLRPSALHPGEAPSGAKRGAVLACLAMTWLNPHVYLDTVFLLGSIASERGSLRWTFGAGAMAASLCWFAALGFGARLLSGVLARPSSWRVLDGLVAVMMIGIGARLALST
ncbi:LysE/ArgO family amino acid transporter [Streptomyces griseus]|uniref:LysE/ArgO family amino acid transporter n=2 Tax=Streptomycetaceae TaxID=2062 RepID=A0ABU2VV18_9ACTN|nr:LysE/ArgO family amino acid transporter [Streptomyces griseus]ARF70855.1 amino acid transporter [Kitasatospora albolonga]MDT0489085.1 LysE/ArgO family amino acid transporter [Streptomyces griseus]